MCWEGFSDLFRDSTTVVSGLTEKTQMQLNPLNLQSPHSHSIGVTTIERILQIVVPLMKRELILAVADTGASCRVSMPMCTGIRIFNPDTPTQRTKPETLNLGNPQPSTLTPHPSTHLSLGLLTRQFLAADRSLTRGGSKLLWGSCVGFCVRVNPKPETRNPKP